MRLSLTKLLYSLRMSSFHLIGTFGSCVGKTCAAWPIVHPTQLCKYTLYLYVLED